MRILLVVDRLYRGGGTETHVLTLARGLQRLGHRVVIYTSGGPWVKQAQRNGLVVAIQKDLRRLSTSDVQAFAEFLRHHQFDVIHAHEVVSFTLCRRVRRFLRSTPPVVFTLHSPYIENSTLHQVRQITKSVISVSDPLKRRVITVTGMTPTKVSVIPNGIDIHTFRPKKHGTTRSVLGIHPERFTIGYAARFTKDKVELGLRVSRALKRYVRSHSSVQVLIAGRESLRHVRPSSHVKVLGHVDDMSVFYNACDVVIGTARVAAEALACGTPTIIVGTGGYRGLVTSRNIGTMIRNNFGDHDTPYHSWTETQLRRDVLSTSRGIQHIYKDTAKVRALIRRNLSTTQMVHHVLKVYRSVSKHGSETSLRSSIASL